MAWTQEKINEVYAKVQRTAMTDEEFRAELLADSSGAIEKLTGEKLPEDFKVKVIENDPQYAATFVLPPMVSDELSDEELDRVAGGGKHCPINQSCGAKACAADSEISLCAKK